VPVPGTSFRSGGIADVDRPAPPEPTKPETGASFEVNGVTYRTAGVTKNQFMSILKLCGRVDRAKGRDYAKNLLLKEFEIQTRVDLTEENAERFIIRLQEVLGE
jgi:hypothetical protein